MQHPCLMVDPAQRFVTWKYPDHLPTEPFFMVYHPCICGHEVRVETVTVHSYLGRGLHAAHQGQMNHYANQALADHLAQNYQYPPQNQENENEEDDEDDDDDDDEIGGEPMYENYEDRPNWPMRPRQPNLLAPVLEEWLVYPEYPEDGEDTENSHRRNVSAARRDNYSRNYSSSDDEFEAER